MGEDIAEAYELSEYEHEGESFIALAKVGLPDAIEQMASDPKLASALKMALAGAAKVRMGGIKFGKHARIITPIDEHLYLFELKHRSTAWRVFAYMHPMGARRVEPVILSHTKGHQGKTPKLPNSEVNKQKRLATIAAELMNKEPGYEKK